MAKAWEPKSCDHSRRKNNEFFWIQSLNQFVIAVLFITLPASELSENGH